MPLASLLLGATEYYVTGSVDLMIVPVHGVELMQKNTKGHYTNGRFVGIFSLFIIVFMGSLFYRAFV